MATAAKKTAPKKTASAKPDAATEDTGATTESQSRELANWDEQMAQDAVKHQKMEESTATGAFFSTKAGVLSWNDSPLENNQMSCIILDAVLENVTYDDDYDEDTRSPPRCFAFARVEEDMKPHESVTTRGQECNTQCAGCERNKYGTADRGRGKACSNRRRLAVIPIGKIDAQGRYVPEKLPKNVEDATMGFLKLPVMSVKNYSAYVKQLSASIGKPPYGVVTRIKVVPDAKSQFRITFEAMAQVERNFGPAILKQVRAAEQGIMQPYNLDSEEPEAKPARGAARGAARGKAAAKKAPARNRKF